MATRFMIFRGSVGVIDQLTQQANEKMAEVESRGGKYIDSHWTTVSPQQNAPVNATLVVVYEEAPFEEAPSADAPKLATFRSF